MNGSLWLWMALAIALFWGVGVYNRLMRMRARGLAALGSVAKHMRKFEEIVVLYANHAANERSMVVPSDGDDELSEWAPLLANLQALDNALKDAKGAPLAIESVARVGEAFEATQRLWQIWCNGSTELAGPVIPDAMRLQWDAATLKVQAARAGFNQILTKYNEAIEQFPARMVVGLLGFKPTGLM